MCLIVLAHRVSDRYPLIIAANRDEDHERPTRAADFWEDAPRVVGGRDELQGGSWLAVHCDGRFAAVTNVRGAMRKSWSRGALVREFVTTTIPIEEFAQKVVYNGEHYAGFHLLAGEVGGRLAYITASEYTFLEPGIHALSNAPPGEKWPKELVAAEFLANALETATVEELMRFLRTDDVFVKGERYGTRASTVVIASSIGIEFYEQNYSANGVRSGDIRRLRLTH